VQGGTKFYEMFFKTEYPFEVSCLLYSSKKSLSMPTVFVWILVQNLNFFAVFFHITFLFFRVMVFSGIATSL
jgi:hypothetical protein